MVFRFLIMICALLLQLSSGMANAQPYVAGGTDWRPFSYANEHGELHGVSVDIARQALKRANIEARFVSYPVNRLQAMLHRGEVDINYAESPAWTRPENRNRYVFSVPYLTVQEHLYFLADDPNIKTPITQLQGMTIGVVRGYTYHVLDAAVQEKRITRLETSKDLVLLELLRNKRVDAVAMVDDLYDFLVATHQIDPASFRQGAQLSAAPLCIMLLSKHANLLPDINAAIIDLQRRGEVKRVRELYRTPPR